MKPTSFCLAALLTAATAAASVRANETYPSCTYPGCEPIQAKTGLFGKPGGFCACLKALLTPRCLPPKAWHNPRPSGVSIPTHPYARGPRDFFMLGDLDY